MIWNGILMSDAYGIEIIQSKISIVERKQWSVKTSKDGWNQVTIRDSQFAYSGHYPASKNPVMNTPLMVCGLVRRLVLLK